MHNIMHLDNVPQYVDHGAAKPSVGFNYRRLMILTTPTTTPIARKCQDFAPPQPGAPPFLASKVVTMW